SHVYSENLVTSAQPTMDQIKELKDAGFEVVINLTPTKEPWFAKEEEKLLEEAGVAYVHVSVSWANPSMDALRQFFSAMKSHSNKKILVHCSHNARASAFVYLYRVALEKAPQQAEYELVEQIWANNPEYPLSKYMIWQDFLTRALPEIQ
ncbi:MAG: hypothetical protein HOH04_13360, partial [Rhodospirillaceae bacterium]|nr:hypothetical protein [Rhodospirillaceae bacterium]